MAEKKRNPPLRKRIIPFRSRKNATTATKNPNPSLTSCHRCKTPTNDLQTLDSQWRVSLLCGPCLGLVLIAEVCSYCFLRFSSSSAVGDGEAFHDCVRCSRRVHRACIPVEHRYYVLGSQVDPESFSCVDCRPAPRYRGAYPSPVVVPDDPPRWVVNGSKRVLKRSRIAPALAVGNDTGCSGEEVVNNEPLAVENTGTRNELNKKVVVSPVSSDKWEWLKYGKQLIKASGYLRYYYRCRSFSKGCLARKQLDQRKTDPGMFVITYIAKHNHVSDVDRDAQFSLDSVGKRMVEKKIKACSSDAPRTDTTMGYSKRRNGNTPSPYYSAVPTAVAVVEPTVSSPKQPADPTPISRMRNQQKVVRHIPADSISSADKWAWLKHGEKCVGSSCYPRCYYKCSSYSKGCIARKHVEKSGTNPQIFIVTYTDNHNHAFPDHQARGNTCKKPSPPKKA